MKKLFALAILALPMAASADHLDVIEFKLKPECGFTKYMAIVKDFNEQWGKSHNYKAEILVPLQRANLETMFWVGRSPNAASFGKGWDEWRDGLANPDSVSSKLWARFQACGTNLNRSSFDTY